MVWCKITRLMAMEETPASLNVTNVADRVQKRLHDRGLSLPNKPKAELPAIGDITKYTDRELGKLLSLYTAYVAYAVGQLSLAEVDEMATERMLEMTSAQAMAKAEGKTLTEQRMNRDRDEEVIKLRNRLMECKSLRHALKATVDGLDRNVSLVSREITRRGQTEGWEHREHKAGHATP